MPNSLDARWMLPGQSSPYLVVWWYDEAARNASRRVSPLAVNKEIDRWLISRRQTLREIHAALNESQFSRSTEFQPEPHAEELKKHLAEAFLAGWLIALKTEPRFPPQLLGKRHDSSSSTPRQAEPVKTEDYVIRFGQDDFVVSFELLPAVGSHTDGKVRMVFQPANIARAYQSEVMYWDVRGREVRPDDAYVSKGTHSVSAVPFQRLLTIPDRTKFRGAFPRNVSRGGVMAYTFDLNGDGAPDFGVRAVVQSGKVFRSYEFTLHDNKKPEEVSYHFIQRDAWKHGYQGNNSPRREDAFLEEILKLTVDMGAGTLPVIGDIVDLAEVVTGYTKWGTKMTTGERVITALAMLLPMVSGALARRVVLGGAPLAAAASTLGRSEEHLVAALKAVEKRSGDKAAIDAMQSSIRAGKALTPEELKQLQRILRQVDADQRFFRAVEQEASAVSILRRGGKIAAEAGPVSLKRLRNVLGRAGVSPAPYSLRKASKADLSALQLQGMDPADVWAWVGRDGAGNVITDWRGRPIVRPLA